MVLIGRSHELPAQDALKCWFTWRRQRSAGDDSLARRRSSRTVDLPNARLIATSVHRCDEVWREPEDESSSDDSADDELE